MLSRHARTLSGSLSCLAAGRGVDPHSGLATQTHQFQIGPEGRFSCPAKSGALDRFRSGYLDLDRAALSRLSYEGLVGVLGETRTPISPGSKPGAFNPFGDKDMTACCVKGPEFLGCLAMQVG